MASHDFLREDFDTAKYEQGNPPRVPALMRKIRRFMKLLRSATFDRTRNATLVDAFASFVSHNEIWYHAQTVVPEFRYARVSQLVCRNQTPEDLLTLD